MFERAAPVKPHECGGPLVDVSGRVVGITIAWVGEHGCVAIPGDYVMGLLDTLRGGGLAANWAGTRVEPGSGRP